MARIILYLHDEIILPIYLRALIILRVLLFPRNLIGMSRLRDFRHSQREILDSAFKGVAHIYFLVLVIVVVIYWFASTGELLYGGKQCIFINQLFFILIFVGKISTTGSNYDKLMNTSYGEQGYWPLNFNDFPSAIVTMFILLQVNDYILPPSNE